MSVSLHAATAVLLAAYRQDIARLNGVTDVAITFSVNPVVEQRIIAAYQQSAEFLQKINIFSVDNAKGEKIGLGVGTTIAGTTNTSITPRRPTPIGALEKLDEYDCTQTNYDVAYRWVLLNAWRHKADFKSILAKMVVRAIALDKITIGFNGLYRAPTSDRVANPLLQDVKKGWLQKIRENAPEQHYAGEDVGGGVHKILIGEDHEFKTIDGLVEHAVDTYIAEQHQDGGDLVVICGRGILSDKYLPLINKVQDPTEQIAAGLIYASKKLGTLPAAHVPKFPVNTILITSFDNLSIYLQTGTLNRFIKSEPEWDRDTDYQSINEDFVVEDYAKCVLLENIEVDD
jgi:P2 family phage major capsid protein